MTISSRSDGHPVGLPRGERPPITLASLQRKVGWWWTFTGRYLTADFRALPHFVIIGTQRGGTTSLYRWLSAHPDFRPALRKEVHYFDNGDPHSFRWYRAFFPFRRRGKITGEASPYMLFHPLAPERAARELPATTRFVVLLREPVERTLSQYYYWRKIGLYETEPLERALALEAERLAPETPRVLAGETSVPHVAYSYVARSEYAPQLERWFDAVGRERILVVESERLYTERAASEQILQFLGLAPIGDPFPLVNSSDRPEVDPALIEELTEHFAPFNRRLFDLLGRELWTGTAPAEIDPEGRG